MSLVSVKQPVYGFVTIHFPAHPGGFLELFQSGETQSEGNTIMSYSLLLIRPHCGIIDLRRVVKL